MTRDRRSYANGNGQSTYNGPNDPWTQGWPCPNAHWWTLGSWPV